MEIDYKKIFTTLKEKNEHDLLICIHNVWEREVGYGEQIAHNNFEDIVEEFYLYDTDVTEVLRMLQYGDHNWSDDFVIINAYGNFESFNFNELYGYININEIVDDINSNHYLQEEIDSYIWRYI